MGRHRLTTEEVSDKYQDLKETLDYYKQKRADSNSDEEKNEYTKKISAAKKNLNNFKRQYVDRLTPEIKKQEQTPRIPIPTTTLKARMRSIEEKAKFLLQQTTDPTERKNIMDRLEACRLRYKYSY